MTTTDLYQKLLIVHHIPAIQGIAQVQDLIKAFAYRGDLYMEKAKMYKKRSVSVLQKIEEIKIGMTKHIHHTRIHIFYSESSIVPEWLADSPFYTFYSTKYLDGRLLFQSNLCTICGDYKTTIMDTRQHTHSYPRCKCVNIHT